jgi:Domain of unknown function (DUF4410)
LKNFFLFFCCAALTACSSVSVVDERENAALAPESAPAALFVRPFQIAKGAQFDVASPAGKEDPRISVARTMTEGVLSRGPRWIAPAKVLGEKDKTPAKGLLIEGSILRAAQGSRALRIGIGFGAGRTHLDTAVRVFNLDASSKKPWFTCKTTGGSNTEPGLITSFVVPSAALLPLVAGLAGRQAHRPRHRCGDSRPSRRARPRSPQSVAEAPGFRRHARRGTECSLVGLERF